MRVSFLGTGAAFVVTAGAMLLVAAQAGPGKKTDEERIVGAWRLTKGTIAGEDAPADIGLVFWVFSKDGKFHTQILGKKETGKLAMYKIVGPGQIDLGVDDMHKAIFKFDDDDHLTICLAEGPKGADRPTKFEAGKGTENALLILERAKSDDKLSPEERDKIKKAIDQAAATELSIKNLRNICLAINEYVDQFRSLPAHAIYSKDGQTPLLSWRVEILPFIGEKALYQQFKLDEPWDSEHNKKLIAKMPKIYEAAVPEKKEEGKTFYQVFTGPDTLFVNAKKHKDLTVLGGTILVIEAGEPVIWTRPSDVAMPNDKSKLPALGGMFPEQMNLVLFGGAVQTIHNQQDPSLMRAWINPNNSEKIDWDKLKAAK
ncbi:MAG TPA: DUF1559 domain-containing protein [Gemmataceae bacterium]|nr:DUF1559 domain-containing protein [Gemmataceae bacterium]